MDSHQDRCWHYHVRKSQQQILESIIKEKSLRQRKFISVQEYGEELDDFENDLIKMPDVVWHGLQLERSKNEKEYYKLLNEWDDVEERMIEARKKLDETEESARNENCFCVPAKK